MKTILALALLCAPQFARADGAFVPRCYCAPIGQSGKVALCVEKNVQPKGLVFDCEAAFYPSADKCDAALEGFTNAGRCR